MIQFDKFFDPKSVCFEFNTMTKQFDNFFDGKYELFDFSVFLNNSIQIFQEFSTKRDSKKIRMQRREKM